MTRLRGLYAITDSELAGPEGPLKQVQDAITGGAGIIQYRDKSGQQSKRRREASALLKLCRQHNVPLIINDDVALAYEINADGVHLGSNDEQLATARSKLGDTAIIGISCYNNFNLAVAAEQAGADYVAFGSFFTSDTKPDAAHAETTLLSRARDELNLPVVAIGGITPENGSPLIQAGADMLAIIRGIFAQPDVISAARAYSVLFEKNNRGTPE